MDRQTLPVLGTIGLALRWSLFVLGRHGLAVLILASVTSSLFLSSAWMFPHIKGQEAGLLRIVITVFCGVLSVLLAVATQNEVLLGDAAAAAYPMARGLPHAPGYIWDSLAANLLTVFVPVPFVVALTLAARAIFPAPSIVATGATMVGVALGVLAAAHIGVRVTLRLPSRALGRPLLWRDVWRLGQGNSWRLLLGWALLLSLLALAILGLSAVVLLGLSFAPGALQTVLVAMGDRDIWKYGAGYRAFSAWGAAASIAINALFLVGWVVISAYMAILFGKLSGMQISGPTRKVLARY